MQISTLRPLIVTLTPRSKIVFTTASCSASIVRHVERPSSSLNAEITAQIEPCSARLRAGIAGQLFLLFWMTRARTLIHWLSLRPCNSRVPTRAKDAAAHLLRATSPTTWRLLDLRCVESMETLAVVDTGVTALEGMVLDALDPLTLIPTFTPIKD
ncbi:hypothetical protein MPH_12083 [Macrophomina phaseolina MS6]|uniref:Uncharacterized protein n=1 Tax=Macrophomina phaseolina (strain MS6) TaxID=1126212 RepID=K2RD24_MACPH|nr:hypothetical protein MPH_12083 [Macrophomina phaseolina MS6]